MKEEAPDFLQKHGIRLVCDNAQGGQLSVSAELLADLFGEEFLAAVPAPRNEESKKSPFSRAFK